MVVKHVFVKLVNINVINNVEIVLHVKIMEIIGQCVVYILINYLEIIR